MNYKSLLIKYIANVIECEGVDFLSHTNPFTKETSKKLFITHEEHLELLTLSAEADKLISESKFANNKA